MTTALINVMSAAAIKAGKGVLRDFSEVDQLQVSRKGTANFVTATDIRTEKLLQKELSKARPDFGFLMEEAGEVAGKDAKHRWVIDPVDGTSNFIHAIPYFCISIGLEERGDDGKSTMIAGVIYDPVHNELFAAERGKGAFLNGRRLRASSRATLADSLLVTGNPGASPMPHEQSMQLISTLLADGATVRYLGATALDLAYLAAGRLDACWYYLAKPWDIAAGLLLVQEAGGMVSGRDGKPVDIYSTTFLASNKPIHPAMQKLFVKFA